MSASQLMPNSELWHENGFPRLSSPEVFGQVNDKGVTDLLRMGGTGYQPVLLGNLPSRIAMTRCWNVGVEREKSARLPRRAGSPCVFSVSRFHVPQGRSKIAQRFIAGLWREHKTSPVRDERTHRSSPIFSIVPPGLGPFSTRNPRLKPWATFGRPYGTFGSVLFRRST